MLPVLLYPILTPMLIGAIQMTTAILGGESRGSNSDSMRLIFVFDVMYVMALYLIEFILVV